MIFVIPSQSKWLRRWNDICDPLAVQVTARGDNEIDDPLAVQLGVRGEHNIYHK